MRRGPRGGLKRRGRILAAALPGLLLAACSDSAPVMASGATVGSTEISAGMTELPAASCASGENLEGGRNYPVTLPSRVDGQPFVFQVFEPDRIDCAGKHALIVHQHGFTGSRLKNPSFSTNLETSTPVRFFTDAGYTVLSLDQIGHGDSAGASRTMDPDFEVQNSILMLDWAEAQLDYLRYRDGNLLLGSIGGSYGSLFQTMLYGYDPQRRLDAMVPEVAVYDAATVFAPNRVFSSYYLPLLNLKTVIDGTRFDPFLDQLIQDGTRRGTLSAEQMAWLSARSPSFYCENFGQGAAPGIQTPPNAALPPVDVLIAQSFPDTLTNFNEAQKLYECFRRFDGDVRLMTVQAGHQILRPVNGNLPTLTDITSLPTRSCADVDVAQATLAWFGEHLLGQAPASDTLGFEHMCYSLSGCDSVFVDAVAVGGERFAIPPTAVGNGPLGKRSVVVPLGHTAGPTVLAGVPTIDLTIEARAGLPECTEADCEPVVFVSVLANPPRRLRDVISDQVTPIRGFGRHRIELAGLAGRLPAGSQLQLRFSPTSLDFPLSASRNAGLRELTVSGEVALPLLGDLPNRQTGRGTLLGFGQVLELPGSCRIRTAPRTRW